MTQKMPAGALRALRRGGDPPLSQREGHFTGPGPSGHVGPDIGHLLLLSSFLHFLSFHCVRALVACRLLSLWRPPAHDRRNDTPFRSPAATRCVLAKSLSLKRPTGRKLKISNQGQKPPGQPGTFTLDEHAESSFLSSLCPRFLRPLVRA